MITITGGVVTARTNGCGAGIGGGGYGAGNKPAGAGGTVTISGGEVTATSTEASGIGGGLGEKENLSNAQDGAPGSFETGNNGKAIIKTNSIADRTKEVSWNGVIFEKDKGKVHDKAELTEDLTVENGQTLDIPDGSELTIPLGKNLNINGTLKNNGTINNNGNINNTGELKNTGEIKNAGTITGEVKNEGNGKVIKVYIHSGVIEPLPENSSSENEKNADTDKNKDKNKDKDKDKDKEATPLKAEISVKAKKGKGKSAEAEISEKTIENAVNKAKDAADKNTDKVKELSLALKIDMPKNTDKLRLNISKGSLEKLQSMNIKALSIDTPLLKTEFDKKAFLEIKKQSKADIVLSVTPSKKLSKEAKKLIDKRPVYETVLSYGDGKGNIKALKKGKIKLYIPYSPDKNEKTGGLYAVYVNKKGRLRKIKGSVYDKKSGCMIFIAKNFGAFGVGYTAN